jgi:hypothetical protein
MKPAKCFPLSHPGVTGKAAEEAGDHMKPEPRFPPHHPRIPKGGEAAAPVKPITILPPLPEKQGARSSSRYTLKLKSGRRVRVRTGEMYTYDGPGSIDIGCQEQVPHRGEKTHTHFWFSCEKNPELINDLYLFVTQYYETYPKKVSKMAMVIGWYLSDDETVFNGPDLNYELIVDRKLSQKLIDEVFDWLCGVFFDLVVWRGMKGLFGEGEGEGEGI